MVNVFIFVTQYNFITKCFCFFYFNLKYYSLFVFVRKMVAYTQNYRAAVRNLMVYLATAWKTDKPNQLQ